jgi:hypothetical protein
MRSPTGWRTCVTLIRRRPIRWRLLSILLTGGDKSGQWKSWYERAVPHAEELYAVYVKERAEEEGQ